MIINISLLVIGIALGYLNYKKDIDDKNSPSKKKTRYRLIFVFTVVFFIINIFLTKSPIVETQQKISHDISIVNTKIDSLLNPKNEFINDELNFEFEQIKEKAFILYKDGICQFESKNYSQAIELFNKAIEMAPISGFYVMLGNCYRQMKSYDRSVQIYLKAIEINSSNISAFNNLIVTYTITHEYEMAIKYCEYLNNYPNDQALAFFNIGTSYYYGDSIELALVYYEKSVDGMYDDLKIPTLFTLGYVYFELKNYSKSIECHLKILEIENGNEKALNKLVTLAHLTGNKEYLASYYERLFKLDSSNIEYLNNLSLMYLYNNDINNAKKYLTIINTMDTLKYHSLNNWAIYFMDNEELDKAIDSLQKSVDLKSGQIRFINLLSNALFTKYKEVSKIEYNIYDSYLVQKIKDTTGLAQIELDIHKYIKRSLIIDDNQPKIWTLLGFVHISLDSNNTLGEYCFEKALSLDPKNKKAQIGLCEIKMNNQQYAIATKMLKELLDLYPWDNEVWYNLAVVYFQQNMYVKALDIFLKLYNEIKDDQNIISSIAVSYYSIGEVSKSLEFCDICDISKINEPYMLLNIGHIYFETNQINKGHEIWSKAMIILCIKPELINTLPISVREEMSQKIQSMRNEKKIF